eukprot:8035765-Alexandrium_andersonii.AAC.1
MLHFAHGGMRMEGDCGTEGPWADCGLRSGYPAMQRSQIRAAERAVWPAGRAETAASQGGLRACLLYTSDAADDM